MFLWCIVGIESDEEIRRVPEMGGETGGTSSASGRDVTAASAGGDRAQPPKKKRGRSSADKENKRLKRLVHYINGFLLLMRKFPILISISYTLGHIEIGVKK